jgi:ABC-type dipeptide/oligopeptide/nickel transport system permease subunit
MAVTLVVISTNMLGEALRRRLDPRTRLDRSKPR